MTMSIDRDLQLLRLNVLCAVSAADRLVQCDRADPRLQRLCLHLYDALEILEARVSEEDVRDDLDRVAD